jgi:Ca2+/H+ antiporter
MNPIISPWWFYLAGLADKAIVVFGMILIVLLVIFIVVLSETDSENMPKLAKICILAFFISIVIILLIPSTDTVNKMIAASYVTPDNLQAAQGNIIDFINKIADAISKAK